MTFFWPELSYILYRPHIIQARIELHIYIQDFVPIKKLMLHAYSIKFMINDIKYNYKVKYPDYFQKVMKKKRLRFT